MTSKLRELTRKKSFWLVTACFLGLIGLADYHYSTVNQIPSDGPLTIGFPITFYWMVCPMIVAVRRAPFWTITGAVFFLTFILSSLATALHSPSHRGRAIEIGFPAVYLYEYGGGSFNAVNLATDLAVCFVAAFFCVAALFRR